MKFGLMFQVPCADWQSPVQRYQETLDQIKLADELGFDHAWLAEMHFASRFSISPSPLMLSAAAAQVTERIRLGAAVSLLPLHNPVRLAEDIATLDLLSDGRAEFGVGRGSMAAHFRGLNVPVEESHERFAEFLDFIVRAWSEEELSFQGKYYSVESLSIVPRPLQKPHPPIRIAANSSETFGVVGKLGYPLFASPITVPRPRLLEGLKVYRQSLSDGGNANEGDVYLNLPVFVGKNADQARRIPEAGVLNYQDILLDSYDTPEMRRAAAQSARMQETQERFRSMTYDGWCDQIAVYGEPAECVEKLQSMREDFGPEEYICWFNAGGLIAHSDVMESMKLFAEAVMPHFR